MSGNWKAQSDHHKAANLAAKRTPTRCPDGSPHRYRITERLTLADPEAPNVGVCRSCGRTEEWPAQPIPDFRTVANEDFTGPYDRTLRGIPSHWRPFAFDQSGLVL